MSRVTRSRGNQRDSNVEGRPRKQAAREFRVVSVLFPTDPLDPRIRATSVGGFAADLGKQTVKVYGETEPKRGAGFRPRLVDILITSPAPRKRERGEIVQTARARLYTFPSWRSRRISLVCAATRRDAPLLVRTQLPPVSRSASPVKLEFLERRNSRNERTFINK